MNYLSDRMKLHFSYFGVGDFPILARNLKKKTTENKSVALSS